MEEKKLTKKQAAAIGWPVAIIGGEEYTLRYAYSAHYKLTGWGLTLGTADCIQSAAAMAGHFAPDGSGDWHTATEFAHPFDLADRLEYGEEAALIVAVTEAIKKAYPETAVSAVAPVIPIDQNKATTDSETKSDSSSSGASPSPSTDSDLPIAASGV